MFNVYVLSLLMGIDYPHEHRYGHKITPAHVWVYSWIKKIYDEHGQVIPIGYKPIVIPTNHQCKQ